MTESLAHQGNSQVAVLPNEAKQRERLELLKRTITASTPLTDDEFKLYLERCRSLGVDPFDRSVHPVRRRRKTKENKWEQYLVFQTGIDVYRQIAEQSGDPFEHGEPQWTPEPETGAQHPVVCRYTVYRWIKGQRCAFPVVVLWNEYVQKKQNGEPTSFWLRMAFFQLAKCAEALALRKAFPKKFKGVYTHDEMDQSPDNVVDVAYSVTQEPDKKRSPKKKSSSRTKSSGGSKKTAANSKGYIPAEHPKRAHVRKLLDSVSVLYAPDDADKAKKVKLQTWEAMCQDVLGEVPTDAQNVQVTEVQVDRMIQGLQTKEKELKDAARKAKRDAERGATGAEG